MGQGRRPSGRPLSATERSALSTESEDRDAREHAETVALKALTFVLSDAGLRNRFIAVSGTAPGDFESQIENPDFLAGVLDFLLANEPDLMAFCEAAQLDPEVPSKAHWALVGLLE